VSKYQAQALLPPDHEYKHVSQVLFLFLKWKTSKMFFENVQKRQYLEEKNLFSAAIS
jgi:hypothetical protein